MLPTSAGRGLGNGMSRHTTAPVTPESARRRLWVRVLTLLVGTMAPVVCLELALWTLPVYGGFRRMPVNDDNPIARFQPDRDFTWSRDWNFSIVNRVSTNNYGFVSDFDYEEHAESPLLAVIGDSFVEAAMVPFRQTCAGRLATRLVRMARVYSFGVSGAPLSQYLAFAKYARDTFRPDGIVIVVIENDYDESLRKYEYAEGYHQFVERGNNLVLERNDFRDGFLHRLGRASALARYLMVNLNMGRNDRVQEFLDQREEHDAGAEGEPQGLRASDSERAVDAFLDRLPESSGLDPNQILFVVDGMRPQLYRDEELEEMNGRYVDVMRRYFIANAITKGYGTIDMQPLFIEHYRAHHERFEWPHDGHWNELGHGVCSDAVSRSKLVSRISGVE